MESNAMRTATMVAKRWGPSAGFSLVDQAVFSGANFLLNVLLARWLVPAEYGAFAVVYALFLFLSGFHNALIVEPMSVLQPAQQSTSLTAYLERVFWAHSGLTVCLGLLIACATFLVDSQALRAALWGLALTVPVILLFWLFRRADYVRTRPESAIRGSMIYAVVLLVGIFAAWERGWLTPFTALITMGCGSFLACGAAWHWLGLRRAAVAKELVGGGIGALAREHWQYGRWIAVANVLSLALTQIQTVVVAALISLDAAGALRAMQTFSFPMSQAVMAISFVGLPVLASAASGKHLHTLRRKGLLISGGLLGLALTYEAVLIIFGGLLERIFYADRYQASEWLIPLLGLWPVFWSVSAGFSLTLRALQKPQYYAYVSVVAVPVGLVSAVIFTKLWGIGGAGASIVLSGATLALMTFVLYQRWTRDDRVGIVKPTI